MRKEEDAVLEGHMVGLKGIGHLLFLKLGSGQMGSLMYICYIYSFVRDIKFIHKLLNLVCIRIPV